MSYKTLLSTTILFFSTIIFGMNHTPSIADIKPYQESPRHEITILDGSQGGAISIFKDKKPNPSAQSQQTLPLKKRISNKLSLPLKKRIQNKEEKNHREGQRSLSSLDEFDGLTESEINSLRRTYRRRPVNIENYDPQTMVSYEVFSNRQKKRNQASRQFAQTRINAKRKRTNNENQINKPVKKRRLDNNEKKEIISENLKNANKNRQEIILI